MPPAPCEIVCGWSREAATGADGMSQAVPTFQVPALKRDPELFLNEFASEDPGGCKATNYPNLLLPESIDYSVTLEDPIPNPTELKPMALKASSLEPPDTRNTNEASIPQSCLGFGSGSFRAL